MENKKIVIVFVMISFTALLLSGCGKQKSTQVFNELSFSMDGIKEVIISYDDEDVSFFQSKNENLVIKEYMNKNKKSYHAKVTRNDTSIKVSEGGKPLFKDGFVRYIEVYLPASYNQNLKITTTDGNIDLSEVALDLDSIRIDCTSGRLRLHEAAASEIHFSSTSGKLELGTIAADRIKIETTKGDVVCQNIEGDVSYTSTSGNAEFLSAVGSGTFKANNSGKLSAAYKEVVGNLYFYNKNDSVKLSLPSSLAFQFEAVTKNGSVSTDFGEAVATNDNITSGTVGNNPAVMIQVETKNGDINVTR